MTLIALYKFVEGGGVGGGGGGAWLWSGSVNIFF